MKAWLKKRYIVPARNSAGGLDPKLIMVAAIREIAELTEAQQVEKLSRIQGDYRALKFIRPIVKENEEYDKHVIESWMKLIKAMIPYSGIIYVAHPDVISHDEIILNSVLNLSASEGVAIMILN